MKKILLVLVILCGKAQAIDLGVFGPVYQIKEQDLLEWIYSKRLPELAQSGEIAKMQHLLQEKARKNIARPKGVVLPRTTKHKISKKSLIVKVAEDLYDADHNLLIARNTKAYPFQALPESKKALLFIDGDSSEQVAFAVREYRRNTQTNIVLTQGKPIELSNKKQVPIYFDQAQVLIDHFKITSVPTKIYRKGHLLYIEEIVLPVAESKR
jgi:conjugal transfer pilus assembly protein TraW